MCEATDGCADRRGRVHALVHKLHLMGRRAQLVDFANAPRSSAVDPGHFPRRRRVAKSLNGQRGPLVLIELRDVVGMIGISVFATCQ